MIMTQDESLLSLNFPSIGALDFASPAIPPSPHAEGSMGSIFCSDELIFGGHPRYRNLMRNTIWRHGEKTSINVPIFKDKNTPSPFIEDLSMLGTPADYATAKPDHIYMDHAVFGFGMCCLQVTFQAQNVTESRWLYDQLTPLTPVLLALSAATPIFRSHLADVDSRYNVISASCDDRTAGERGLAPLTYPGKWQLAKSRHGTTDCYLHPSSAKYNDQPLEMDENFYNQLREGGIDEHMSKHIAHLFIRDPLQVFRERIEQDDANCSEHFETLNCGNWRTLRFKPPPDNSPNIGWRVEFRPTEIQLTDFENAAIASFIFLLTRVIAHSRMSFLLPITMVHENIQRAQKRDAVLYQKFYFRKINHYFLEDLSAPEEQCDGESITEMSIQEIICGNGDDFPGLTTLIRHYLDSTEVDLETRATISQYLSFIEKRASGQIWTLAHWIRDFVNNHPAYTHNSVVPDETVYDLMKKMDAISDGREHCPNLLG
ncbi:hypothetical protein PENTCL1PPCAC_2787, partial [Pristionchus entomophagus]